MKWLAILVLLSVLSGCSAPVWETVEDLQPADAVMIQEPPYAILIGLPEQAVLVGETGDTCLYEAGELEILTTRFQASDLEAAVRQVSGYGADRLDILQTTRFDMPEYQFAWYSETAEGGRVYRADLVMDDMTCYAVVCSTPEASGTGMEQARAVFATFGLSEQDSV